MLTVPPGQNKHRFRRLRVCPIQVLDQCYVPACGFASKRAKAGLDKALVYKLATLPTTSGSYSPMSAAFVY